MEIKLLKTFIMESYNSLTALRRAEQSTEAEARYQPMSGGSHPVVHHGYGDGSTYPICVSSAFESPIPLSQSPTSYASKSDDEGSKSDGGADDDDIDDANSTKSKDQSDPDDPAPKGDTSNADGLTSGISSMPRLSYNDSSDSSIHRESNLFLQMVPYRPGGLDPIRSDRLISDKQDHDRGTKSATEEATNSVRLLLDKWTTSGSAPVSNILDEEAAREKDEASVEGPSSVLGHANIVSSASFLISVELQTIYTIGTDGPHRQESNITRKVLVLHMTQESMSILLLFETIKHDTEIPFINNKISGNRLFTLLNHQIDDLRERSWPHCAQQGGVFII